MSPIALQCLLHPASAEAKDRVLTLLNGSKAAFQAPEAQCTAWCYFTPAKSKAAPSMMIPADEKETAVGGMEIYDDKAALSTMLESPGFKEYHAKIKAEGLYSQDEDLVAWYPVAGFVSREDTSPSAKIVMLAKFQCKEAGRDKLVEILRCVIFGSSFPRCTRDNRPSPRS